MDVSEEEVGQAVDVDDRMRATMARHRDQFRRLGRVAAALSATPGADEVCSIVVREAHAALAADWSGVWLLDEARTNLEVVASCGGTEEQRNRCRSYPLAMDNPLCLAVRSDENVWIETWSDYARRFPASEARVRATSAGRMAFACLPLQDADRPIGGLVLTFFSERTFDDDERGFLALFAQHCAQGIARARLYDQALAAIRAREDFLSVAGHELRTPLATLMMHTQSLLDDLDTKASVDVRKRLGPVQRTLRRMIRLTDDVLDVARVRAGRLRLEPEPIDLGALVSETARRIVADYRRAGSLLCVEHCESIEGRWDPMRIEQIVSNLVTNACKYGGEGPVMVRAARCPEGAEIVVRDHGIGIAPEDQARIFERFERTESTEGFAGLGLGLWIVKAIVALHGGTISVRSEVGQGAEFRVVLPLAQPR